MRLFKDNKGKYSINYKIESLEKTIKFDDFGALWYWVQQEKEEICQAIPLEKIRKVMM